MSIVQLPQAGESSCVICVVPFAIHDGVLLLHLGGKALPFLPCDRLLAWRG